MVRRKRSKSFDLSNETLLKRIKKIMSWHLRQRSKTQDWLEALSNAINEQLPGGVSEAQGLKLLSDNGSQYTSVKFMAACKAMDSKQIFTSYNNSKGNADTERIIRTIQEDLIWPRDWFSFQQLNLALQDWFKDDNKDFNRSAIIYKISFQFEHHCLTKNNNFLSHKVS